MIIEPQDIDRIYMYPDFKLEKDKRDKQNEYIEDLCSILKTPRKNKVLRDVNELINSETKGKDIYDLTSVNPNRNNKIYKKNLGFW